LGQCPSHAREQACPVRRPLGPALLLAHQALADLPIGRDDLGVDGRRRASPAGRDDGAQVG